MLINMLKIILILFYVGVFSEVKSKTNNVLRLSCEFDPNSIKQKQKDIGYLEDKKIDRDQICRILGCEDIIEVNKNETTINDKYEYRLRNSWFNHQGILLDDFLVTKNNITINTFVSQAYFLDSYFINTATGKTKRTFYRFNDPEFINKINKIQQSKTKKESLYNDNGKLSLKTLKLYSLKPTETFYFKGNCYKGTGV